MKMIIIFIIGLLVFLHAQENISKKKKKVEIIGLIQQEGKYVLLTDTGNVTLPKEKALKTYFFSIYGDSTINYQLLPDAQHELPGFLILNPLEKDKKLTPQLYIPLKTKPDSLKK